MLGLQLFIGFTMTCAGLLFSLFVLNAWRLKKTYAEGFNAFTSIPLQGDPDIVKEANEYRIDVRNRVIAGLMKMGPDGVIWFPELLAAFEYQKNAAWWLSMREQLEGMDDTVVVQVLSFSTFDDQLAQCGMDVDVHVLALDDEGGVQEIHS